MIALSKVCKVFNSGKINEFRALRDVTLAIDMGQVTVIKGPSGSGKTTLLSVLGGMTRPTSGRIVLNGREITSLPERFLSDVRRRTFGFIFQQFNLVRGLTTLDNVMFPAFPTGECQKRIRERALLLLEQFGMEGRIDVRVEFLSGGEMQRVAIARAMINDPAVIIADEPTAHLDSALSAEFLKHMGRLRDAGKTIVMASHDPLVFNDDLATRLIEMRDGIVIDDGTLP